MPEAPVPYAVDVETLRDDEAKTIGELNESFDTILETTAEAYGHAVRAVHAKAHGAIRGTVREEMAGIGGVWRFRVQLCRDLDKRLDRAGGAPPPRRHQPRLARDLRPLLRLPPASERLPGPRAGGLTRGLPPAAG